MPHALPLKDFLKQKGLTLDVRSPGEYHQGHIPNSYSFPLFTDGERSQIGTTYKKQGHSEAVELGLLLFEPKLPRWLDEITALTNPSGKVICWRGGMRSGFTARMIELLGIQTFTLQGGYQAYRRWALQRLAKAIASPSMLRILGGFTGSGKTAILQALRNQGEQVIDLEALAKHRGSAFGGIGLPPQPTQEQFENDLAFQLEQLDWNQPVWVEDESRLIGRCHLPPALYLAMHQTHLYVIQCSRAERLQNLMQQYGRASQEQFIKATSCISKRLGSQLTREINCLFELDQKIAAFELLLTYYDRTYQHQISQRNNVHFLPEIEQATPSDWAKCLVEYSSHQ